MLIIMTCILSLKTKTIDFVDSFAQSNLNFPSVYIYCPPRGYLGHDTLIMLKNGIYGQVEAPRLRFEKLDKVMEDKCFVPSKADPFVFMSDKVFFPLYVHY